MDMNSLVTVRAGQLVDALTKAYGNGMIDGALEDIGIETDPKSRVEESLRLLFPDYYADKEVLHND